MTEQEAKTITTKELISARKNYSEALVQLPLDIQHLLPIIFEDWIFGQNHFDFAFTELGTLKVTSAAWHKIKLINNSHAKTLLHAWALRHTFV